MARNGNDLNDSPQPAPGRPAGKATDFGKNRPPQRKLSANSQNLCYYHKQKAVPKNAGAEQTNDPKEEQSMTLTLEEAKKRMEENNGNLDLNGMNITALPE